MANKLISQLTGAGANLQDTDYMEGQKLAESETKKFTGLQMRQVEKTERETQDNVIEASVGLNVDGSYTPPANSWSLRAADYAAGCVDRGGATGALTQTILNGLRLLDARANQTQDLIVKYLNVNADATWGNVVPAGYMIEYVVLEEKAGQSPILSLGSTAGGNQVFTNQALTTSGLTLITCPYIFSMTAAQTLYLNDDTAGDTWDGSTVDVYLCLKSLRSIGVVGGGGGYSLINYQEYDGLTWCNIPDNSMIEAILGVATDYPAGTVFTLKDTDATCGFTYIYFVMSDGATWWVNSSTFTEAV